MSQCEILVDYFNSGKSLTIAEALTRFGIYALSQRVGELKRKGFSMESETVEINGKHLKRYRMKVGDENSEDFT